MAVRSTDRRAQVDWYRIRLSRDEYEGGEVGVIQGAFRQIYIASNGPEGMAMFGVRENGDDGYSIYFTPSSLPHARALVKAYSAVPHAPPAWGSAALIFGNPAGTTQVTREF